MSKLLKLNKPGLIAENELAKQLVQEAMADVFNDNITVGIQTIAAEEPFIIGIYDGHGGDYASSYLAANLINEFVSLCTMRREDYDKQPFSFHLSSYVYNTDNDPVVRNCADRIYRILYPMDLLKKENIELISTYPTDRQIMIRKIVEYYDSVDLCDPGLFYQIVQRPDLFDLFGCFNLFNGHKLLTKDIIGPSKK